MRWISQFWLLTLKNLILIWRNKVWTLLEIVVPLLIGVPMLIKGGKWMGNSPRAHGRVGGLPLAMDSTPHDYVYTVANPKQQPNAALLLEKYQQIVNALEPPGKPLNLTLFKNRAAMQKFLQNQTDVEKGPGHSGTLGAFGIEILHINVKSAVFDYRIWVPGEAKKWKFGENWAFTNSRTDLFGGTPVDQPSMYAVNRVLKMQLILDDAFIQMTKLVKTDRTRDEIVYHSFAAPAPPLKWFQPLVSGIPGLIAVLLFPGIIHLAKDISFEVEIGLREYMQVMGLSPLLFYLSHGFIGWLKSMLLLPFFAFPLFRYFDMLPLLFPALVVFLYSLSVTSFAIFCSSTLKTSSSVFKLTMILWVMMALQPIVSGPKLEEVMWCFILSLNPNQAFVLAVDIWLSYDERNNRMSLTDAATGWTEHFNLASVYIMLIVGALNATVISPLNRQVDTLWMFLGALLMDRLRSEETSFLRDAIARMSSPTTERPIKGDAGGDQLVDEVDEARNVAQGDIEVKDVTKKYGLGGGWALKGVNLKAIQGQITVLLGHNGAGKSTTFSILCGMASATSGTVKVNSKPVGLCPQKNPLFPKLTVAEHLWFFHHLKGGQDDHKLAGAALMHDLKFADKKNEMQGLGEAAQKTVSEVLAGDAGSFSLGPPHGRQIEMTIPMSNKDNFPKMCQALEKLKEDGKAVTGSVVLVDFGMSLNTLEQVFLKVGEIGEGKKEEADRGTATAWASAARLDVLPMLLAHFLAMLKKRVLYNLKNIPQFVVQIVIPIVLFLCINYVCNRVTTEVDSIVVGPSTIQPGHCVLQVFSGSQTSAQRLRKLLSNGCGLLELSAKKNFAIEVVQATQDLPRLAVGIQLHDKVQSNVHIHAWYNPNGYHTTPLMINIADTFRLQERTDLDTARITTGFHVFPLDAELEEIMTGFFKKLRKFVLIPLLLLAFSILTSGFIVLLVEERTSNFQHQQLLTKLHPVTFWGASIVYDLLLCLLVCAAGILILYMGDVLGATALKRLSALWALYLWACLPFIYCLSYLFSSSAKANTLLIIWQVISPIVATICVVAIFVWIIVDMIMSGAEGSFTKVKVAMVPLLLVFPPFGMCMGVIYVILVEFEMAIPLEKYMDLSWYWELPLITMSVFGALTAVLFVLLSSRGVRRAVLGFAGAACIHRRRPRYVDADEDVAAERDYVMRNAQQNWPLLVSDLLKWFGCQKQPAVDQITFAVEPGQCFGLLGTNGAGKTTTIDILTGLKEASGGAIRVYGQQGTRSSAIGYCPQFDAVLMDFTGREVLKIMATCHGYSEPGKVATQVLAAVGMSHDGDKRIKFCSGGQKRKISVGVALLAQDAIRILDEPTAGVDPKARRDIWMHLDLSRQPAGRTAQLLTSHSMEECEALCTKISIMIKGRMVAIGSSQHLKSKYSGGYTMTVELKPDESGEQDPVKLHELMTASVEALTQAMTAFFPEIKIKEAGASRTCIYVVPSTTLSWSAAWESIGKLCSDPKLRIADYSVTQCGLEDTFLKVTAQANNVPA
ncbi:unnamed protein product, partial [Mesorhabditis spiculigera]